MGNRLDVDEPAQLLAFLRRRLAGWKRTTLEQRLRAGCVRVNGTITSRATTALLPGDLVSISGADEGDPARLVTNRPGRAGFTILHADEHLIAIDKPAGLLSVSTDREKERTALALLRELLSRPGSRPGRGAKLWPIHRLDRDTSGVLLFAKNREACDVLQHHWAETQKVYLAIVAGHPTPPQGVIEQPLLEDDDLRVRVAHHPDAKPARTRYSTLRAFQGRALLEIELDTGRRHQIRAHLAWLGHPIVGDPRYGRAAPRMGLHALRLAVTHPANGRRLVLEAPPPPGFEALLSERSE